MVEMSRILNIFGTVAILVLFSGSEGNPAVKSEISGAKPSDLTSSRITPRMSDWILGKWTFPSFTAARNFFNDENATKNFSLIESRVENLERSYKEILELVKKMSRDFGAYTSSINVAKVPAKKRQEMPILELEIDDQGNKELVANKTIVQNATTLSSTIEVTTIGVITGQTSKKVEKLEEPIKPIDKIEQSTQKNVERNQLIVKIIETTKPEGNI